MVSVVKHKLEVFIRSYYRQRVIQGIVYSCIQTLLLFFLANYTESAFWLDTAYRGLLFYVLLLSVFALLIYQVFWPLGKMLNANGKRLSEEQAAQIIGDYFPEISDKLLNLLQLEKLGSTESQGSLLLTKSIEQKTQQLKTFSFTDALDWPSFKKSMTRFSALVIFLIGWGIFDSAQLSNAATRIFHYDKAFERPAPFDFLPVFSDTLLVENSNLNIQLTLKGKAIPDRVAVVYNGQESLMMPKSKGMFTFDLSEVKESLSISFKAGGFESITQNIRVIPKFQLEQIQATAIFPKYLNKESQPLNSAEDWLLPSGTQIQWSVKSDGADKLLFQTNDRLYTHQSTKKTGAFDWNLKTVQPINVKLWAQGTGITSDTFFKSINVIEDAFPEVEIEGTISEDKPSVFVILGNATDDYGISKAYVEVKKFEEGSTSDVIPIKHYGGSQLLISEWLDLSKYKVDKGGTLQIRVAVSDNDGVKGSKTTYSQWLTWERPTEREIEEQVQSGKDRIEKQLSEAQSKSKQLQKQSEAIQNAMSFSPHLNSELEEKVSDWMEKQLEQLKSLEKIRQEQEKLNTKQENIAPKNEDLKERRESLEERMKRMEDPKLQALMKELQELLERKKSPQEIQQKMNQIERRMQQQQQEMDQLLEQLKELRLEEQIDFQAQKMEEWIQKQQELAEKTKELEAKSLNAQEKEKLKEDLAKELEAQKAKAAEIQKRAQEIKEQNKKLESPMKLETGQEEIKKAEQEQKEAEQQLKQNKSRGSQQKQQDAAQHMQEAQEKMQESLEKAQQERNSEDLQALRALLENLIAVSHKQERVFTELSGLNGENPRVRALNQEQMSIKAMSQGIEDSLRALAKRQPMVSDMVTREIADINDNMERAFDGLKVRNVRQAAAFEQYVMTGYNNLAVMLMESLKNVQQRMNQQSSSSPKNGKMCNNPKPGNSGKSQKGKGSKLSEQQKQLGEKLQQMQQQGKEGEGKQQGKKQGDKGDKSGSQAGDKPGKEGGKQQGENGQKSGGNQERLSDKEWVEMVLMQEQIRRQIEALRKEALKEGQTGQAANLFEAEKLMDEQEKKWAQKQFDTEMMLRQKQIETRLLEHEKAQLKQRQDEQRQSKSPENTQFDIPLDWIESQRKKLSEKEQLKRANPQWRPYYRNKSESYLRDL